MDSKRRIAVMIGSDTDLVQCIEGLRFLKASPHAQVVEIVTNSIHRNTRKVLANLERLASRDLDVLIVGAGWANHLTGICDAYLRYTLKNAKTVVVGVAFEDGRDPRHTSAAILSITEVPGSQVVFNQFVGSKGFVEACQYAVYGDLPMLTIPESLPIKHRTLEAAIDDARTLRA